MNASLLNYRIGLMAVAAFLFAAPPLIATGPGTVYNVPPDVLPTTPGLIPILSEGEIVNLHDGGSWST